VFLAVAAMLLALPAATLAGTPVGQWMVEIRTTQKRALCEFPYAIVTVETVSWPGECTGRNRKNGSVSFTLTVLDPLGVVQAECTQQAKVPKRTTVPVGCTVANPGFPVDWAAARPAPLPPFG